MTNFLRTLFLQIADPLATAIEPGQLESQTVPELLELLDNHGMEAIALRKLRGLKSLDPQIDTWLEKAETSQFGANIVSMKLISEWDTVGERLAEANIAHEVVKGPLFAEDIYPNLSDRPFTDIDLIVGADDFSRTRPIMEPLGFYLGLRSNTDKSDHYLEQKWQRGTSPMILIEIHADMIHYPGLRRQASFGLHQIRECDAISRELRHLFTAIVHGLSGHKLHNFHFLVDILQAWRALGVADRAHLKPMAEKLNLLRELVAGLWLVDQAFAPPELNETLAEIAGPKGAAKLASPLTLDAVLDAPFNSKSSRVRRNAFRMRQNIGA